MTEWSEMGVTWTPARVAFNSRGTGILPVGPVGFQPAEVKRSGGTPDRPHRLEVCATLHRYPNVLEPPSVRLPPGLYA